MFIRFFALLACPTQPPTDTGTATFAPKTDTGNVPPPEFAPLAADPAR